MCGTCACGKWVCAPMVEFKLTKLITFFFFALLSVSTAAINEAVVVTADVDLCVCVLCLFVGIHVRRSGIVNKCLKWVRTGAAQWNAIALEYTIKYSQMVWTAMQRLPFIRNICVWSLYLHTATVEKDWYQSNWIFPKSPRSYIPTVCSRIKRNYRWWSSYLKACMRYTFMHCSVSFFWYSKQQIAA